MNARRALLGLVVAALVILGFVYWNSNGRWRSVNVTEAQVGLFDRENSIELYVPACNADLVADVRENDEAVLVLISMRNVWRGMDCGGGLAVTLAEPLGERVLIDLYDWEPIDILGGESP